MSDEMGSISIWIDRLKAGQDDATAALWQRYFTRLVGLAHKRLVGVPYRGDVAEDVAVSVFHSFFRRAGAGGFQRLDDRGDLWQLLAVLTSRKAVSARRREGAGKRGSGQVVAASNLGPSPDEQTADVFGNLAAAEPTPEEAAAAVEEFHRLLDLLGDEELRQVALARLEGFTNEEIADRMCISLATVERKLARVRTRWRNEVGCLTDR
jgi:RNA polymerase sigma factor (sigma-70 family)